MGNRLYTWTEKEESHEYDDIINLPHFVSATRPHMSMLDRAAQFSPFAALTGYDESISETARMTDERLELSDMQVEILSDKLNMLSEICLQVNRQSVGYEALLPSVTVTYFVEDAALHRHSNKSGGAYLTYTGKLKRVDLTQRKLFFYREEVGQKEQVIDITDIIEITGEDLSDVDRRYE